MATFDFESTCVEDEEFNDTGTATCIRKHITTSVSLFCNFLEDPMLICGVNPRDLVSFFTGPLENPATQSKAQLKDKILEAETRTRKKVARILEILTQRRTHRIGIHGDSDNVSTQFQQVQKNQVSDFQ